MLQITENDKMRQGYSNEYLPAIWFVFFLFHVEVNGCALSFP